MKPFKSADYFIKVSYHIAESPDHFPDNNLESFLLLKLEIRVSQNLAKLGGGRR